MSLVKFEITEDHLKVLNYLRWSINNQNIIVGISDEDALPFNENSIYDAMNLIFNGKPDKEFDPIDDEVVEYTEEQKTQWDKLYSELPMCLEIILSKNNMNFQPGKYKTKHYDINWIKIN